MNNELWKNIYFDTVSQEPFKTGVYTSKEAAETGSERSPKEWVYMGAVQVKETVYG